jgi:hypothetical protein
MFAGLLGPVLIPVASARTEPCPGTAVYQVSVDTQWSEVTHPLAFPGSDALVENVRGAIHASDVFWFAPGKPFQALDEDQYTDFHMEIRCPQPGEPTLQTLSSAMLVR